MKIAIQGGKASFHEAAAEKYFGNMEIIECRTFRELCSLVENKEADKGIMAVENTLAGSILPNYSLLEEFPLHITGEVYIRIEHYLMALPGTKTEDIRQVKTHPMALAQCGDFLEKHNKMRGIEYYDTADAAKDIKQRQLKNTAAIAGKKAASLYGLDILESNIENIKNNYTRFLIISREANTNGESNKASLNFRLEHKPGALAKALTSLSEHGVNLSLIQSLPIPGYPEEYAFHLDLQWGNIEKFRTSLEEIKAYTHDLKILGIYKSGKIPYESESGKAA